MEVFVSFSRKDAANVKASLMLNMEKAPSVLVVYLRPHVVCRVNLNPSTRRHYHFTQPVEVVLSCSQLSSRIHHKSEYQTGGKRLCYAKRGAQCGDGDGSFSSCTSLSHDTHGWATIVTIMTTTIALGHKQTPSSSLAASAVPCSSREAKTRRD